MPHQSAGPPGPPQWALGSIQTVLAHLAAPGGQLTEPADQMLDVLHAAVPAWAADPVRYAEHLALLTDLYYARYQREQRPADLDRALEVWRHVRPDAPGISGLIAARLRMMGVQVEDAVAWRDGGPAGLAASVSAHSKSLRADLAHLRSPSILGDLLRNATRWAEMVAANGDWAAAADAMDLATRTADTLRRTLPLKQRARAIAENAHLPLDAASALARADRLNEALVVLEVARQQQVRTWREHADVDRVLKVRDPALYAELIDAQTQWSQVLRSHFGLNQAADIDAAVAEADAAEQRLIPILERVRRIPGLERYWMRASIREIREVAAEAPILYVWTSRHDTALALVLPDGTVKGTLLGGLTREYLGKLLKPWADCIDPTVATDGQTRQSTLAILARTLETHFVPAMTTLLSGPSNNPSGPDDWVWGPVTIIVCGLLSFMPVHAWAPAILGPRPGTIQAVMPLNYAPSARQAHTVRRPPRPTGSSRRLLSLADPVTGRPELAPLPCARLEAAAISSRAVEPLLFEGATATRDAFAANAAAHEVIHLACHGVISTTEPGGSRLELADGPLGVNEIANVASLDDVALIVLSACRSGQPDPFLPDEALDVGSMLLAAGARAVVANMWPVDDLAAALFVSCLFRLWDWGAGVPLPLAVAQARWWLKELTVARLLALGEENPAWRPHIHRYSRLLPPGHKRFSEPYYWAAFAYSGS